mgnify:CR=1 FL=1
MKLSQNERKAFFIFNGVLLILFIASALTGNNTNKTFENKLCLKYAAKKCNNLDEEKIKSICNTLTSHKRSIATIKNYYECNRKD